MKGGGMGGDARNRIEEGKGSFRGSGMMKA